MKWGYNIVFVFLLLLCSCNKVNWESRRLERTLHEQQHRAEELTNRLCYAIEANSFDSLWLYSQLDENIVFYIYHGNQMVYWSNAWLTSSKRMKNPVLDAWQFMQWDNAQGVCYRRRVNDFLVVVAIPVKYHYSVTSTQLHNSFVPPFRGDEALQLVARQADDSDPVYSNDGTYLFSVTRQEGTQMSENQLVNMDDMLKSVNESISSK